jgi:hypothetical protein
VVQIAPVPDLLYQARPIGEPVQMRERRRGGASRRAKSESDKKACAFECHNRFPVFALPANAESRFAAFCHAERNQTKNAKSNLPPHPLLRMKRIFD